MPIKDRRTKILLLIFLTTDLSFDYVEMTSDLQEIYDVSLNQKTKGTLSSMIKAGVLEKKPTNEVSGNENNGKTAYRLTDKGFYELCLEFPFFRFLKDEWDGLWRIISYEIPENKRHLRDRLRRSMRGWGLGPWHRSFWLTPHPIISNLRDLVYGREEEQYIEAFEATHVFGDMDVLVEKVWNKSMLDKGYRDLFKSWHSILSEDKENKDKFKTILYSYIKYVRNDPGLPESLVGKNWIAYEAINIFKEVREILMK